MTAPEGTVFFLPGLLFGPAAATPLATAIGSRFRVVGIDLSGQAGAPDAAGGPVTQLVDRAIDRIEAEADGGPFVIAAHTTSVTIAAVVTDRILSGDANVFGLAGAVLLAASPSGAGTTGGALSEPAVFGDIDLPLAVVAGDDDDDLRASSLAAEIVRLWDATVSVSPQITPEWGRLIASDRTEPEARGFFSRRALADHPDYTPRALSPGQIVMLRALADRLLPQPDGRRVDLAARVDADLAMGRGDGWRNAGQPPDVSAYRLGLDDLASLWPDDTDEQNAAAEQDALIDGILSGELNDHDPQAGTDWSGTMRQHWFDDVPTDLTRIWLSHPASLARVGYDGFATSGSATGGVGYETVAADMRDPWEPAELGSLASGDGVDEENAA